MNNFTVLIVDDEVDFLETLIKRLQRRNVDAAGVGSGQEALEFLSRTPRDVVVLDVKMAGMDGIETLRQIKKSWPETEVIMLTGHANTEVAMTGMELGAFDYLMKPTSLEDLLYKLEDAYKKKTLMQNGLNEDNAPQ